jgi:hypothetical protein
MASRALAAYEASGGKRLVYVGEHESDGVNATGDERFFEQLKDWRLVKVVHIPRWWPNSDAMFVFERP